MSTNLELVQDLRQETTDSGAGPTTVVSQSGELARFVKWIKDSWVDLQNDREDWLWLRREFTVNTVSGTDSYAYADCTDTVAAAVITRFARWYDNLDMNGCSYFSCYLAATGVSDQQYLSPMAWDAFRRVYKFGSQTNARPVHFSIGPDQKIWLGPKPDAVYTVAGVYQRGPQEMTLDADVPEMPSRFHRLIVYEAMMRYGGNRVAPEAMLRAASEGGQL